MSIQSAPRRITVTDIAARKGGEPIVCLTAYHAHTARLVDPHVDLVLVGDSLGMVMHGLPSTIGVTLDMMIAHGRAVVRGTERALVVVDLPFGSYETSPEDAFRAAARVMMETGAGAVKLEGGAHMEDTVAFLVQRGIPVMGHVGLTPQSFHVRGGFKAQGRTRADWPRIKADARAICDAGAFAIVLEAIAEPLAARISADLPTVTIGIGASPTCDGQILVLEDMLGLNPSPPRFVRAYGSLTEQIGTAVESYAQDVRSRAFPGPENVYEVQD